MDDGPNGEDVIQVEHILPVLQLHRARAPFVPSGNLREARQRFERDYIASVLHHHAHDPDYHDSAETNPYTASASAPQGAQLTAATPQVDGNMFVAALEGNNTPTPQPEPKGSGEPQAVQG